MKKTLGVVLVLISAPLGALAQSNFVPLAPIPGLNDSGSGVDATSQGVATFLNNIYVFAIGIAVILAVGMIIYGGVLIVMNQGSPPMHSAGMKHIRQALFGLVLVLAPALVFGIINPAILNLRVNFEPLHTQWGNYQGDSFTNASTDSAGGLTLTNTCGSDGCASKVASCSGNEARYTATCVGASGGSRYAPGTAGATAGQCKSGDTIECYEAPRLPSL